MAFGAKVVATYPSIEPLSLIELFLSCTFVCSVVNQSLPSGSKEGGLNSIFSFFIMQTMILRVVQQGEAYAVQSQKAEGGQMQKCNIVLQELGGKYENQYVAAMLGNMALCRYAAGDIVAARLRFQTREYNGQMYQDIVVTDIASMSVQKY